MSSETIIILVLLVVLVFFFFRNSRKRKRDQAELQSKMVPGSEVMLTFGIYGKLVSVDEENNTAEVEISDGNVIKVHRQTLGRVVEPVATEYPEVSDEAVAAAEEGPVSTSYSLNEDHAIKAGDPAFGERVETKPATPHETDKDN